MKVINAIKELFLKLDQELKDLYFAKREDEKFQKEVQEMSDTLFGDCLFQSDFKEVSIEEVFKK